jgi:hypothetical protein
VDPKVSMAQWVPGSIISTVMWQGTDEGARNRQEKRHKEARYFGKRALKGKTMLLHDLPATMMS